MNQAEFCVAAIQSSSHAGDISRNVAHHVSLTRLAVKQGAKVAVFPELSLTGYEPTLAADNAIDADNEILLPLQQVADELGATIIAGCPIQSAEDRPYIGAFIFRHRRNIELYRKRFVHSDEQPYFMSGADSVVCESHGQKIGVAICADISNEQHPLDVSKEDAAIYAAGVAMTPEDISKASARMSMYAARFGFLSVMANYASDTGGYSMAGGSGAWDESGALVAQAEPCGECVVLAKATPNGWQGRIVDASDS